jgi:hypothetical protein
MSNALKELAPLPEIVASSDAHVESGRCNLSEDDFADFREILARIRSEKAGADE